jgi:RNA polymerase sigma-70 factor (ECF subfamily)
MSIGRFPTTSPTMLDGLRQEDREAWGAFLGRYYETILTWCAQSHRPDGDTAEVSNRVLAKLLKVFPRFRYEPEKRFRGWLKKVVMNVVRDYDREGSRRPRPVALDDPIFGAIIPRDAGCDALDEATRERLLAESQRIVAEVRGKVRESTWLAFVRTAIGGEPIPAVAEALNMSRPAVTQAKYHVGKLLREAGDGVKW